MTNPGSPEGVLRAVAAHGLPGSLLCLPAEPLTDQTWTQVLDRSRRHGLLGLLAATVTSGALRVTSAQEEEVVARHLATATTTLFLERLLLYSAEVLGEAGVPCRVLKGAALAHLDYPDAAIRPFNDIDLLVSPSHLAKAITALRARGFRDRDAGVSPDFAARFGKSVTLLGEEGLELDLHCALFDGYFGRVVRVPDLFSDATEFSLAGRPLLALDHDSRALHACLNAVLGDAPPRLVTLRDVAETLLFGEYDDDRLRDRAAGWQVEAVIARAVTDTWQTLELADATGLSSWAQRFTPSRADAYRIRAHATEGLNYASRVLPALALLSWRERLTFTRSMAFPSDEFLAGQRTTRARWLARGISRTASRGRRLLRDAS